MRHRKLSTIKSKYETAALKNQQNHTIDGKFS